VLGRPHLAPGINYRQVWARMVSQLVVKSEVALGWGGRTFWILQDTLVDYISATTALDVRGFLASMPSEVNVLCFSFGEEYKRESGVLHLGTGHLYAGPIASGGEGVSRPSFQDMIRAPVKPPLSALLNLLIRRAPSNRLEL